MIFKTWEDLPELVRQNIRSYYGGGISLVALAYESGIELCLPGPNEKGNGDFVLLMTNGFGFY